LDVVVADVVVDVVVTRGRVSPAVVAIGTPAPVSVAVVAVAGGLTVPVALWVLSDGLPLHAAHIARTATKVRALFICIVTSWQSD
jgi:hypothetical protein